MHQQRSNQYSVNAVSTVANAELSPTTVCFASSTGKLCCVSSSIFGFCNTSETRRLRTSPVSRRACRRAQLRMANEQSGGGDTTDPPPGHVITTALEVAFRAVWVQLLTAGIGREYEAAITDFCVACIAARKAGM